MASSTVAAVVWHLLIENMASSGAGTDEVWVSVLGLDPVSKEEGYLDLHGNSGLVVPGTWRYQTGVYSARLADLPQVGNASLVAVPPVQSARLYMFIGRDAGGTMPFSGPSASRTESLMFDKVEFDTSVPGEHNINPTCVDFYGVSYTVKAADAHGGGAMRSVGITAPRSDVVSRLLHTPAFFPTLAVRGPDTVLRVLAPKTAGYTDWGATPDQQNATWRQFTHYLDAYVRAAFPEGREFEFHDKLWPAPSSRRYYASVAGGRIGLFTSPARTPPAVRSLTLPFTAPPNPANVDGEDFHNVASADAAHIDWGFVLMGNAGGGPASAAAWWAEDPAAIAIMVSICRGVAHLSNTAEMDYWTNSSYYYRPSASYPGFYYSSVLHGVGEQGAVYALSYDDVYGQESAIFPASPLDGSPTNVTITLHSLR